MKQNKELLNTTEAAARLGVTISRVQQLIWAGKLPAQKVGRDYIINAEDLALVKERNRVGRPRKAKPEAKPARRAA